MLKTAYPDMDELILELAELVKATLPKEALAMYLLGSLVGGDFDPKTSDIDLVVIVKEEVNMSQLKKLKFMHDRFAAKRKEWDDRVEVSYVSVDGMKYFKTTINKIARISPGEPLHMRDMDTHWLTDWYVVQEQGQIVFGPSPSNFIPKITEDEYIQSVKQDILPEVYKAAKKAQHKGYQSYVVMSLCRGMCALASGKQVSKFAGAKWAADRYPEWAQLISDAVDWHGHLDKSDSPETRKMVVGFAEFVATEAPKLIKAK